MARGAAITRRHGLRKIRQSIMFKVFTIRKTMDCTKTEKTAEKEILSQLATARILPLLFHFAWPALITTTLHLLYNVVDRVFVGRVCGADAIAGLALTFPIMSVIGAVGVLIGAGSGAVISILLGEDRKQDAERALGQCVAMKIAFGIVMPLLMYFFLLDPLLQMMVGGEEGIGPETLAAGKQYLLIVVPFTLFSHLAFGLSNCMRAEGAPKQSMYCMFVGFGLNLILDPIFIYVFDWGIAGAAWATNLAMTLSCLFSLWHYLSGRSILHLRFRTIRFYKDLAGRALSIGLSPFLMQLAASAIVFSFNNALSAYSTGPEMATIQIGAYGILQTILMVCFMPMMGISQGLTPILGFNWGARNYGRVRQTFLIGLALISTCCFFACVIPIVFARELTSCFTTIPEMKDVCTIAIYVGNCMVWCIGINVTANGYFQAIGRPRIAILLSLLRQVICLLPCIWILPKLFPQHALQMVWLSMPISDLVANLATIPPVLKELAFLKHAAKAQTDGCALAGESRS